MPRAKGVIPSIVAISLTLWRFKDQETAKDHGVGITMTSKMQSQGFTAPELEEKLQADWSPKVGWVYHSIVALYGFHSFSTFGITVSPLVLSGDLAKFTLWQDPTARPTLASDVFAPFIWEIITHLCSFAQVEARCSVKFMQHYMQPQSWFVQFLDTSWHLKRKACTKLPPNFSRDVPSKMPQSPFVLRSAVPVTHPYHDHHVPIHYYWG